MKLLIYLPSHKRPQQLSCQIHAIDQFAKDIGYDIHVFVNLNGDEISTIDCSNVSLVQNSNPSNVGANINIGLGFLTFKRHSEFDFFWLLSDDDQVVGLPSLDYLERCNADGIELIHLASQDKAYSTLDKGNFLTFGGYPGLGLISLGIYSKKFIQTMDLSSSLEDGIRFSFPHLVIIYRNLRGGLKVRSLKYNKIIKDLNFKESLTGYIPSLRHFPYFYNELSYPIAVLEASKWALTCTNFFWRSERNKKSFIYSMGGLVITYPPALIFALLGICLHPKLKNILKRIVN